MLNLTPHTISLSLMDGTVIDFPPSGTVARVAVTSTVVGTLFGAPVVKTVYGDVIGVPTDTDQDILVSMAVLDRLPGRPNTYAPDTGQTAIRMPRV